MLKMKCPKCRETIVSALLSDLMEVTCSHCEEMVTVEDIMVSAEGFTFHRNDLNKRLHTYKNLLQDLLKERELLDNDPNASPEGRRSLERMAQALRDLMATGRNNYRVYFSGNQTLQYRFDTDLHTGIIEDLSMSGACITADKAGGLPRKNKDLTLEFTLPGKNHRFIIDAVVSWASKKQFGVSFKSIMPEDCALLWEYIATEAEGAVPNATIRPCPCNKA